MAVRGIHQSNVHQPVGKKRAKLAGLYLLDTSSKKRKYQHEINNPKIRFPVLEGDKLMKEVLNGGS